MTTVDSVDLDEGEDLGEGEELGSSRRFVRRLTHRAAPEQPTAFVEASGDEVLKLAGGHLGERYVLGARAPMANAGWGGPWDCAEFVSWCVYQVSKVLFGTEPRNDAVLADAYTGFWFDQARSLPGSLIDWRTAASIRGAVVLRRPMSGQQGHIVFSDGRGGTVEAHSARRGVTIDTLNDRRWDCGVLVPGLRYSRADQRIEVHAETAHILRLTSPLMQGRRVERVQRRLADLGYPIGTVDGVYGPQTAQAVRAFQARNGLVVDAEVGSTTASALDIPLT